MHNDIKRGEDQRLFVSVVGAAGRGWGDTCGMHGGYPGKRGMGKKVVFVAWYSGKAAFL